MFCRSYEEFSWGITTKARRHKGCQGEGFRKLVNNPSCASCLRAFVVVPFRLRLIFFHFLSSAAAIIAQEPNVFTASDLRFKMSEAGKNPAGQAIYLSNTGKEPLEFEISASEKWVEVGKSKGKIEPGGLEMIHVSVNGKDLKAGAYKAKITVGSRTTLDAALEVAPHAPQISLSKNSLELSGPQEVKVTNSGAGKLAFRAIPNADWIKVSIEKDTLTISSEDLPPGTYSGFVTIDSADADNSPQRIEVTHTVKPEVSGKWTVMVYMNADNDLEEEGLKNINKMEEAEQSENVNVIAMIDRHPEYDESDGDWAGAKIFKIGHDDDSSKITSKVLKDLGEVDMCDPKVFSDFCQLAMKQFPADHYCLVVWDHGMGWEGAGADETSETEFPLSALKAGLKAVGTKFDVIAFDECLMSQLEVASEIAPFALFMSASEEVSSATGIDYKSVLTFLAKNPGISAQSLAVHFCKTFSDFYSVTDPDPVFTTTALKLAAIPGVARAAADLAETLSSRVDSESLNVSRAAYGVETFEGTEEYFIDLGDFCTILGQLTSDKSLKQSCEHVISEIRKAVLYNSSGTNRPPPLTHGLSIYFPAEFSDEEVLKDYKKNSAFASDGKWLQMVDSVYKKLSGDDKKPEITALKLSDSKCTVTVQDNSAIHAVNLVTTKDNIIIFSRPIAAPKQLRLDDGRKVNLWEKGPYDISVEWESVAMAISDGISTYYTTVALDSGNQEAAFIPAKLKMPEEKEAAAASLLFNLRTGELISIYAEDEFGDISEVELEDGDKITIAARTLDEKETETGTFTFSEDSNPIFLARLKLPPGEYKAGILIGDHYSNIQSATIPVKVK